MLRSRNAVLLLCALALLALATAPMTAPKYETRRMAFGTPESGLYQPCVVTDDRAACVPLNEWAALGYELVSVTTVDGYNVGMFRVLAAGDSKP